MVAPSFSRLWLCDTAQYKNEFEVEFEELGRGKYGQVFYARYEGKVCVAKEYFKVNKEKLVKCFSEWEGMRLQHENIASYHMVSSITNSDRAVVLMDRLEQNLPAAIDDTDLSSPDIVLAVVRGIAHGLAFLHSNNIVHCDLIPCNILLSVPGHTPKISDYGNSHVVPIATCITGHNKHTEHYDYFPPELLEMDTYDSSFDVFSFGHLTLYILLRRHPHSLKSHNYMFNGKRIPRTEVERREECFNEVKKLTNFTFLEYLLQWVEMCLSDEEHMRPHIKDFDTHMKN